MNKITKSGIRISARAVANIASDASQTKAQSDTTKVNETETETQETQTVPQVSTPISTTPLLSTTICTGRGEVSKTFAALFGEPRRLPARPPDGIMPEKYDTDLRVWLRGLEPEAQMQFGDNTLLALSELQPENFKSDVELWQSAERQAAKATIKFQNPQPKQRTWYD